LAVVKLEIGNLDHISRILIVVGYVASGEGFIDQPMVVNGASDLLVDIFGDNGKHARVAIGVAELPGNVPVEVEMIFEIRGAKAKTKIEPNMVQDDLLTKAEKKSKARTRSR
jgi:hypothetical protein